MGAGAGSRYVTFRDVLPDPAGPAAGFEAALARLVARRRYEAVVATSDLTLARLATISVPVPTVPDVRAPYIALTDKLRLEELSCGAGVAYPPTRLLADDDTVSSVVSDLGLPLYVKSIRSGEASGEVAVEARGAQRCTLVDEVVNRARALRAQGLIPIAQRAIPFTEKLNAVVLRSRGSSELTYAHRVLREVPTTGGIGIALVSIPSVAGPGREAVDVLERIVDAAGYEGIAQAELYRSAEDGRLYLIDVNPRLWGSTSFAEGLGLQVVERAVRFALGMPRLPAAKYAEGRRFHAAPSELKWLREQRDLRRGLAELARTTRPWDAFEFIDVRDPVPFALIVLGVLMRRGQAVRSATEDGAERRARARTR